MARVAYVVRPHPTKNKPLVTPCTSLKHVNTLLKEIKDAQVTFSKTHIGSGEDCFVKEVVHG